MLHCYNDTLVYTTDTACYIVTLVDIIVEVQPITLLHRCTSIYGLVKIYWLLHCYTSCNYKSNGNMEWYIRSTLVF